MASEATDALRDAPTVFVTDTEGNFDSFVRALRPPHLAFHFVDAACLPTRPFRLIFGGDASSRGKEDLRLLKHLKVLAAHPLCRVRKLVGNRDTMFFRLADHLHPVRLVTPLHEHSCFFVTHAQFDQAQVERTAHALSDNVELRAVELDQLRARGAQLLAEVREANSAVRDALADHPVFVALAAARLRTLTQCTMGSPHTFELRRTELRELGQAHDDAAVVESYRASLRPHDGALVEYLRDADIAIIENGRVFVHGCD